MLSTSCHLFYLFPPLLTLFPVPQMQLHLKCSPVNFFLRPPFDTCALPFIDLCDLIHLNSDAMFLEFHLSYLQPQTCKVTTYLEAMSQLPEIYYPFGQIISWCQGVTCRQFWIL